MGKRRTTSQADKNGATMYLTNKANVANARKHDGHQAEIQQETKYGLF